MKIVFMGTPDFACSALQALIQAGHEITLVVTQPDKPKGRGKEISMSPVKECAINHNIPIFQPTKIRTEESISYLKQFEAEVFVVAAFGQILSNEILTMPRYGCLNIHASLLPKYRGAAPIQWAILNGESESGVTIMQMDAGVDTGDILLSSVVNITSKETGDSLHDKLAEAGSKLICEALMKLHQGELVPIKQDDSLSIKAPKLDKGMGRIKWSESAAIINRTIRGLNSWPGTFTTYNGKNLKVWEAEVIDSKSDGHPGSIAELSKTDLVINTGDHKLNLLVVQPEGKRKMHIDEFLRGYKIDEETVFQ